MLPRYHGNIAERGHKGEKRRVEDGRGGGGEFREKRKIEMNKESEVGEKKWRRHEEVDQKNKQRRRWEVKEGSRKRVREATSEERRGKEARKEKGEKWRWRCDYNQVIFSSVTTLHLLCGGTVTTQPNWLGRFGNNQSNHDNSGHTARAGSREHCDFLLRCKCAAVLNWLWTTAPVCFFSFFVLRFTPAMHHGLCSSTV